MVDDEVMEIEALLMGSTDEVHVGTARGYNSAWLMGEGSSEQAERRQGTTRAGRISLVLEAGRLE
jgi:hypothetical protein